jgi:hypothetical protein
MVPSVRVGGGEGRGAQHLGDARGRSASEHPHKLKRTTHQGAHHQLMASRAQQVPESAG